MVIYVAKSFGRYHYFKTEEKRTAWLNTLPEWEQKAVELWSYLLGGGKK